MSEATVYPGGAEEPPPPAGTRGVVYILTNPAMPGLVKIGRTAGTLEMRLKQLDTTGVPVPFECFHAAEVGDIAFVERRLHTAFGDHRVRLSREFFRIGPDRVKAALDLVGGKDVTPTQDVVQSADDQSALNRERARRGALRFSTLGIPVGSRLVSTFDERQTCVVVDDRRVEFRGQVQSLYAAAVVVVADQNKKTPVHSGPRCWTFNGVTLEDLRDEKEGGNDADV